MKKTNDLAIIAEPNATILVEGEVNESIGIIQNIENLIVSHVETIKQKTQERKAGVEQIDSILMNDSDYRRLTDESKRVTKERNALKKRIKNHNSAISSKIDERATEIKDMKEALADYCAEYYRLTGSDELTMPDGRTLRIRMKATVQLPLF